MSLTSDQNGNICLDYNTSAIPPNGLTLATNLGFRRKVVTLSAIANTTLTASQSGTTFYIPQQTASNTVTLPTAVAGISYKFICSATADGTHTFTLTAPSTLLNGNTYGVAAGLVGTVFTGRTNLIIGATAANLKAGDGFEIECDGTNWWIRGWSNGTASCFSTS